MHAWRGAKPVARCDRGARLDLSIAYLNACVAVLVTWGVIGFAGLIRPYSIEFAGRT